MFILDQVCSDYGIAWIAKILKTVFQMIQIIGPVLAIISLAIIFFNSVTASESKSFETNKKKIRNCLVALLITFFLPVFVNLVMSATFMSNTFEIGACWKEADSIKSGKGSYIKKNNGRNGTGTFIIDPSQYKGTNGNPNDSSGNSGTGSANTEELFKACEEQAEWMKNYKYEWEKNPTVEKSKKKGTCVTYVACVLQRVGALKPGKAIWHNGSGYGTGKVSGTTSSMTVNYMNNKTLAALKSQLQAGDVIMVDDNKSGVKGNGGHIFIFTGEWASNGNPLIYDNHSATKVKNGKKAKHEYSKSRKVLAVVRLN